MSAPVKKPRTEVRLTIHGKIRLFEGVPEKKMSRILSVIEPYEEEVVPWRYVLRESITKYGEPGTILKGSRVKDGMTQTELAGKLGVPQQHISEMENGKRPIGKKMAKRLGLVFGTDYRIFL